MYFCNINLKNKVEKMTENLMSNNNVTLIGKIVSEPVFSHQVFGEGFFESVLQVSRLSEQVDNIPITISERLMQDYPLEVGCEMGVSGQFRSYNKMVDGRSKLMLTVFVREVLEDISDQNPNIIELVGYICKEPIFRTTPFKREICDILVAVNRAYNKSDYLPCIAWGRNARYASSLEIGSKIAINGRIQSREYQKVIDENIIESRVAFEISINRIALADEYSENYL